MPITDGIPNHAAKTAAAPVINPLTFTTTENPSNANASQVNTIFNLPVNNSFSKHLINCAPLLFNDSSAIIKCNNRFIQYATAAIQIMSCQLFLDARKGADRIPDPTPCPIIILVDSKNVSLDSPCTFIIF